MLKWLILHFKNPQNWFHVKSDWYKNHEISTLCPTSSATYDNLTMPQQFHTWFYKIHLRNNKRANLPTGIYFFFPLCERSIWLLNRNTREPFFSVGGEDFLSFEVVDLRSLPSKRGFCVCDCCFLTSGWVSAFNFYDFTVCALVTNSEKAINVVAVQLWNYSWKFAVKLSASAAIFSNNPLSFTHVT